MKLLYRFVKWAFSRGTLHYWCIFAYDTLSVLVSGLFVYTLQYGVDNLYTNLNRVGLGIGLCMVLYMLAFFIFHTFNGVLRYSSFIDLRRVAYSSFTASIAICVFHQLQIRFGLSNYILVPRFVSGVQIFITATMLMWTARMAAKALYDLYNNFGISKNVFIYGAQSGAVALARSIVSDPSSRYKIKGFISDNEMMTSSRISGIKVYEDSPELVETMRKLHVQALLVSPLQTEHFTHDTKFIDGLIAAKIKIMMMPPAEEWDGKSTISHTLLHEVDIEELLLRDKIEVDMEAIKKMLTGHRILITGAAGSIGSEMARQVATFKPSELILVDQAETPMHDVRLYMMNHHKDLKVWSIVGSITNESQMEQTFAAHKPEFVFHAAAYKHVPMMEDNPAMAIQNNVFGTRVIADLAVKYQTRKFVMISTDKAVNPTNVMGCSKRICEIYCQSLNKAIQDGEVKGVTQFVTTPLRQRARLQRIGHPALQRADQEGRPRHRHPQGHHALLHAHPRGLPPGAGGWHDGPWRRDLRLRHGRSCPHRRPGSAHDRTLGSQKRQDRIHGNARRRETLRGGAQRRGADQADRPPEDQGGCRPRILLQAGAQERNGPLRPLPAV